MPTKFPDVDAYLATLPTESRAALEKLRAVTCRVAPDAVESISYGMPAFKYHGKPLIYFGVAKNHCAIYGPIVVDQHESLSRYETSKGTLRFSPAEPLPSRLVENMLRARMAAIDTEKAKPAKS